MQVLLIILSIGLLFAIIYFAVSPKSSRLLKLCSIVALGFIAASLAVCGLILLRGPGKVQNTIPFLFPGDQPPEPVKNSNISMIVTFALIFVFLLGLIISTTRKEKLRGPVVTKKAPSSSAARNSVPLDEKPAEEQDKNKGEGDFDLGFD